ncbi:PREDICTED: putative F-box protein At3g10430 [Ipomoea nil]|uniref:putative F-box protein At3g10430 n=1 Tax=Ipomoea nil TaxID=35883 RepID=UPI000901B600|nr:PREDICTED: putative F-box protein At3g10430 [Ipomoea nil]
MESCKLPRDLVVDILSRLRVKSLMRFKCVCKFFYDLIKSDQHFMDKHYEISKAKTDCVLLEVGRDFREYYLLYKESECNEIGCIYLDIPGMQWVKCCKGMLCLISTKNDKLDKGDYLIYDILMWNPSIRKVKALPSVTVPYKAPCDGLYALSEFGFGISNNMTWKVVMLLEICSSDGRTVHQMTMVYSQDYSDSWSLRQLNLVTSFQNIRDMSNDFYLKGRYYWGTVGFNQQHIIHYLIWFDMNNEVCGMIELPKSNIDSVSIMNETIAVLRYSPIVGNTNCIDIWLMIENDNNTYWCKQARIDYGLNIYNNIEWWRPIGIWNVDGELLVFQDRAVDPDWDPDSEHSEPDVPYFISQDLVTQERKMFSISKERKSITIASNPTAGNLFQVYNERNTDTIEKWKYHMFMQRIYSRVYYESLYLP